MRFELFIVILGILLILAMILTLLFGKEHGRHGYGVVNPHPQGPSLVALALP